MQGRGRRRRRPAARGRREPAGAHRLRSGRSSGRRCGLIELVLGLKPDLVLVDIRMPPTHSVEGLEAALAIRRELPDTGIVVLSAHVEVEHAMELLASGRRGTGYLLKGRVTDVDEFVDTLDRIARGASVIDPAMVQELIAARHRNDPLAELSSREREVLSLMAEGRSNAGRAAPVRDREHCGEARSQHPHQAPDPRDRRRSQAGAGGGCLPGVSPTPLRPGRAGFASSLTIASFETSAFERNPRAPLSAARSA
jgi:CheY-like chemotaxis protein